MRIPLPRTNARRTLPDATARPVCGSAESIEHYLQRRRKAGRVLIAVQLLLGLGAVIVLGWYLLRPGAPGPAALRYAVMLAGVLSLAWAIRALPALALLSNARVLIVRSIEPGEDDLNDIVEVAGIDLDAVHKRGPIRCIPQFSRHIEPGDNVLVQPTYDGWQVVAMPGAWATDTPGE